MLHALRLLLLSLAALAFAPAAAQAQLNGSDIELTQTYALSGASTGRQLDMAYTKDGALILAWVEYRPNFDDRIVVVRYQPSSGTWTLLSNAAYGLAHILEIAITVPTRMHPVDPNLDRVFVVAHFAQNTGFPVDHEWIALIYGPQKTPWGTPNANGWPKNGGPGHFTVVSDIPQPLASWRRMHPTVACVPTVGNDFTQYTVELAFAYTELASGEETILWSRSKTFGLTLQPTQRLSGPSHVLAGPNASEVASGSFRHPSCVSDDKNAAFVVAFQDDTRKIVRVVGGQPATAMSYSFGTPANDNRDELAPSLTSYDKRVFFTCLEGAVAQGGGRTLALYDGIHYDPSSFRKLGTLHSLAMTPGDVAVREGQVYVAARCKNDNVPNSGAPVFSFRGNTQLNSTYTQEIVSDFTTLGAEPRVAITPDSVSPAWTSFGYTVRDWTVNGQVDAGFVDVDL